MSVSCLPSSADAVLTVFSCSHGSPCCSNVAFESDSPALMAAAARGEAHRGARVHCIMHRPQPSCSRRRTQSKTPQDARSLKEVSSWALAALALTSFWPSRSSSRQACRGLPQLSAVRQKQLWGVSFCCGTVSLQKDMLHLVPCLPRQKSQNCRAPQICLFGRLRDEEQRRLLLGIRRLWSWYSKKHGTRAAVPSIQPVQISLHSICFKRIFYKSACRIDESTPVKRSLR